MSHHTKPRQSRNSRHGRHDEYVDSYADDHHHRDHKHRSRAKSFDYDEETRRRGALEVRPRDHHSDRGRTHSVDRRHHHSSRDRGHKSSRNAHHNKQIDEELKSDRKMEHAVKAAFEAAAVESYRLRKEPGEWIGPRGARVATAAVSAAIVDGFRNKNPDTHGKRNVTESAIGGLLANRLVNGPRDGLRRSSNR